MSYSAIERKDLGACFRRAKMYVWDGADPWSDREKYICHAITQTYSAERIKTMAKDIINERLNSGLTAGFGIGCLENWLRYNVPDIARIQDSGQALDSKMLQATRHAWLDSLIEEFSK